jgi:hypothetical protein
MVQEVLKIGAETLQTFTRLDRHPFYLRSARRVALAAASTSEKFGTLTCKIQSVLLGRPHRRLISEFPDFAKLDTMPLRL